MSRFTFERKRIMTVLYMFKVIIRLNMYSLTKEGGFEAYKHALLHLIMKRCRFICSFSEREN